MFALSFFIVSEASVMALVVPSIVFTVSRISFTPAFSSSIPSWISFIKPSISMIFEPTFSNALDDFCDDSTIPFMAVAIPSKSSLMAFDWVVAVSAKARISSATTLNPFPSSPA